MLFCVRSLALVVGERMLEGRKFWLSWAFVLREVPSVIDWFLEVTNDGVALSWDRFSVGVLVAHHDNGFTVDRKSVMKLCVSLFEVVDTAIENVKLFSVISNQLSVIINILIVYVDVLVICMNKLTCGLYTCLQT